MILRTLRARLIASYVLIIFLSLVLAGGSALALLQRYQYRAQLVHLTGTARALSLAVPDLYLSGATRPGIWLQLSERARELRLRVLLLSQDGVVLADTGPRPGLRGTHIPLPPPDRFADPSRPPIERYVAPTGSKFLFIILPIRRAENQVEGSRPRPGFMALAVPAKDVGVAWRELAPLLLSSAVLALVVSILVGIYLSGSITRPLTAMTHASEAIARGDYDQAIPAEGDDEVARLARAFNTMAREVSRARQMQRDFLANVSHDLKTPLTSIQGFSQALLDGSVQDDDMRLKAARIIHEEAGRMNRLVHDLLDLARIESGQIDMAREEVDLVEMLSDCAEKFSLRAEQKEIALQSRLPSRLPPVMGDAGRLEQVFTNLLDNAFAHTPRGGAIEIAAFQTSEGTVEATVSDSGSGIPPEDLPRIFERFYRVDKARAQPGGTGLGLAIAKEIIQAHGGRIAASSQLNQGSRFTVVLPLK